VWWWERKTGNGKCGIEESEKGRGDDEGNVIIGNAAVYNEQSRHKEVSTWLCECTGKYCSHSCTTK